MRGTATTRLYVNACNRDHPRVCGEQAYQSKHALVISGSPPRVRGTVGRQGISNRIPRITPACAGNRSHGFTISTFPEDHPRVCGEQAAMKYGDFKKTGSPPRVRGTAGNCVAFFTTFRITPACAGNRLPMITILGASSLRTAASDQNASAIPLLIGRMMTFGTISNRAVFLTIRCMMKGLSVSVASAAPWRPKLSVKNSSSAGQNTAWHIFAPLSVAWLAGALWVKNTRGSGGARFDSWINDGG